MRHDEQVCVSCGKARPAYWFSGYGRRCKSCRDASARVLRRKAQSYREWALARGASPGAPYIQYRCDRCRRTNMGQEGCEPRNWFRIPGQYTPLPATSSEPRHIPGLLCGRCGDAWERAHRNAPLDLAPGLTVTPRVHRSLEEQARREIPRPSRMVASDRASAVIGALWFPGIIGAATLAYHLCQEDVLNVWVAIAAVGLGGYWLPLGADAAVRRWGEPARLAYRQAVRARVLDKAGVRQAILQERALFYGSPEWRGLRQRVIYEEGRCCASCGVTIAESGDITVDHIRPRSKYPDLALVRDNLQVLCRQCNSQKGAADPERDVEPSVSLTSASP